MAFVDIGVGVAAAFGAEGIGTVAAGAIGSGLVGAGTGALMAGIQGKNVLNGALMGGALGAVGGGIGGSFMSGAGDATGMIGDSINSMARAGATTEEITQSLMDTYGFTANQAASAIDASVGSTAGGINMATANAADQAAGIASNITPSAASVPVGSTQSAVQGAKTAMTQPTNYGQYLKYGVPAAMMMYGSGMFGNKTSNPGITQQSTVGQSQPNPNIRGLSPNYQSSYQQSLMAAEGGIMKLATGGPSMTPDVSQSTYNPADVNQAQTNALSPATQALLNQYGINPTQATQALGALQSQGIGTKTAAEGGIMGYSHGGKSEYHLGGYSDGGRLLKGPGDGMSDEIPATIAHKQPARLAEGEFVVPADVVSHLGNGSTDAGAKHLYKMMDNVRHARTGKKKQAKQIKADKFLPKTK